MRILLLNSCLSKQWSMNLESTLIHFLILYKTLFKKARFLDVNAKPFSAVL